MSSHFHRRNPGGFLLTRRGDVEKSKRRFAPAPVGRLEYYGLKHDGPATVSINIAR